MNKDNAGHTSKEMLDAYIYDFLLKSSLNTTASIFCKEAGMAIERDEDDVKGEREVSDALKEIKDVPQGFLYEWWQIFWDLFNARTHKKGSELAEQYSEISLQKRKLEYSRRSVAVQAARMQHLAEENADYENELLDGMSFSAGIPNTRPSNNVRTKGTNTSKSDHVQVPNNLPGFYNNTSSPTPTPPAPSVSSKGKAHKHQSTKKGNSSMNSGLNNLDSKSPHTVVSNVSTPYENQNNGPNSVGKISGIEGLFNYQKQLMVSETEINNSKRNMLPPSAGISPQTAPPSTSNVTTNNTAIPPNRSKMPRRKSTTYLMGSTPKIPQNSASDVVYSQSGPATPISVTNNNVICGDNISMNNKPVLPSSLSTVSEGYSKKTVSANNSPDTSKKVGKKVRKPKKSQPITNNNSNYNFITSASVPTPPTDSQQKSQFKILNKNQSKKGTTRNNKGIMKSSSDASPRLTLDETSSTTPTFINTVWNNTNKKVQTPHSNFTFVGENTGFNPATNSISNTDTTLGSSSGGSYQFSENETEDLLSMNSVLPTHDSNTITNNIQTADKSHEIHDTSQQDFNLELLESTEPSFNFLSWQQ